MMCMLCLWRVEVANDLKVPARKELRELYDTVEVYGSRARIYSLSFDRILYLQYTHICTLLHSDDPTARSNTTHFSQVSMES